MSLNEKPNQCGLEGDQRGLHLPDCDGPSARHPESSLEIYPLIIIIPVFNRYYF